MQTLRNIGILIAIFGAIDLVLRVAESPYAVFGFIKAMEPAKAIAASIGLIVLGGVFIGVATVVKRQADLKATSSRESQEARSSDSEA